MTNVKCVAKIMVMMTNSITPNGLGMFSAWFGIRNLKIQIQMKKEQNLNNSTKQELTTPVVTNRYFHELEQKEVDALIADKKTIGYIMETYKQPDWCKYPNALEGQMGCWSLMDLSKDGLRTKISKDFCKGCDEYSL